MGASLSYLLMLSNYSHDIATAFLFVSGIGMALISRIVAEPADQAAARQFVALYRTITTIARYSLEWILIAGVPRIIFYRQFEWSDAAGDLQVVAIVIKHIVMFTLVGIGIYYWSRLSRRIRTLTEAYSIS